MAPQFQAPSFVRPQTYEGIERIPQTLDSIINAYVQAKKEREAKALAANESTLKYGFDVSQTNPQEIMQARQMAGQQGPDQQGMNPRIAAIRELYRKQFATSEMENRKSEADIALTESQTQKNLREPSQTIKPPPGYRWSAGGLSLEQIPGGPAESKSTEAADKAEQAKNSAKVHAYNVIETGDKALKAVTGWTTGLTGKALEKLPGTDRKSLQGYLDTLKGNLSFERLTEMRQQSKTGGALGNVSDRELQLLSSTVASLDPDQDPKVLRANIQKVIDTYQNITKKLEGGEQKAQSSGGDIALSGDKAARLAELRAKMGKK